MIRLGLTGSVGMGKSTVAAMFAAEGISVFDADKAVHGLYQGPLAPAIEAAFPSTTSNGTVDRAQLAAAVLGRPEALHRLESIVHPAVREAERAFIAEAKHAGRSAVLLDIPLLFENGRERDVDLTIVVSAPVSVQRARVLNRGGMSEERLAAMLDRQMSDADKRLRADIVIDTARGLEETRAEVAAICRRLGL